MRTIIMGLLFIGCAHERVYSLGDDFSVEENERGIYVWNERPSVIYGMQKGPIFMARPSKDHATNGCFEGFYNPEEVTFQESRTYIMQPFALCPDPDAPSDRSAFRLDLRVATDRDVEQFPFTARVVAAGSTDVTLEGKQARRVQLPRDSGPFREHPELIGALIAVGVLPESKAGLRR